MCLRSKNRRDGGGVGSVSRPIRRATTPADRLHAHLIRQSRRGNRGRRRSAGTERPPLRPSARGTVRRGTRQKRPTLPRRRITGTVPGERVTSPSTGAFPRAATHGRAFSCPSPAPRLGMSSAWRAVRSTALPEGRPLAITESLPSTIRTRRGVHTERRLVCVGIDEVYGD